MKKSITRIILFRFRKKFPTKKKQIEMLNHFQSSISNLNEYVKNVDWFAMIHWYRKMSVNCLSFLISWYKFLSLSIGMRFVFFRLIIVFKIWILNTHWTTRPNEMSEIKKEWIRNDVNKEKETKKLNKINRIPKWP